MDQSILVKRVRVSDIVITAAIYAAASLSILLLAGIVCYTFVKGISSISWQFLTTVPSSLKGTFGIAGNLLNTLYIVVITLVIATPIGVGSAIYLNEYAKPGKVVRTIEFTTEIPFRHPFNNFWPVRHGFFRKYPGPWLFHYNRRPYIDAYGAASHYPQHAGSAENSAGKLSERGRWEWGPPDGI